ncbi:hypothetical protein ACH4NR_37310 [Streptomyces globisporus]|uniref:hypothetical protein n=1 Tax=Streptomyces globisporus TaxID=1908 RepID=UPI00379BF972
MVGPKPSPAPLVASADSARFKETVGAFDSTPFVDEESQWNLSLEELEHGIW